MVTKDNSFSHKKKHSRSKIATQVQNSDETKPMAVATIVTKDKKQTTEDALDSNNEESEGFASAYIVQAKDDQQKAEESTEKKKTIH